MSLDGLSLSALVAELQSTLCSGRIERIFQPDSYTIAILVRIPGKTVRLIVSCDPRQPRIHFSASGPENPDTPPTFCMLLRKHLEDGRISAVSQHALDRIVMLSIDIREEGGAIVTKTLVIELMGKHSNVILVQNDVILDAMRRVGPSMSRFRLVFPGRTYVLPPGQDRINLLNTQIDEYIEILKQQTGHIQKAIINTATGIGPVTVKELLWRAGSVSGEIRTIDESGWLRLRQAILSVLEPMRQGIVNAQVRIDTFNRVTGIAAFPLEHLVNDQTHDFCTMSGALEFITMLTPQAVPDKERLQKFVGNELIRLRRKRELLSTELAEAKTADTMRRKADILMTYLPSIEQGIASIDLPDIFSEDPNRPPLNITLDPRETPLKNAQLYYSRYNKLKRAEQNIESQLDQLNHELTYLESVQLMLEHAVTIKETREIEQELIVEGYIAKAGKKRPEPVSAPITISLGDGSSITIGKNNRQNDLVTFKYARPDDIWFHTKDIPGSHVILRSEGSTDDSDLLTAAQFAAYFSKARQSSNVPVDYTLRRYVKKPNGSKPGFVIYDRQTTIYVTPDEKDIMQILTNKNGLKKGR